MQTKLNYLLDQSTAFDESKVQELDKLTNAIKSGSPEGKEAHDIWNRLKEDNYFWVNAEPVLKYSKVNQTKVFMLVTLEEAIKQKWYALQEPQREAIKSIIVNLVLEYGAVQNLPRSMHNILSKGNSTLVQIVKYEWNTTWRSFINDICSSSLKDMNICENNFYILKMLSQQIFDYSKNQMTKIQIKQLKQQMTNDFTTIYQLCKIVLQKANEVKQSLVKACLETLNVFLSWIPMYYIIYTDLIDKLIVMIGSNYLRHHALQCLVEIAALPIDDNNQEDKIKFINMLRNVTIQLNNIIPLNNPDDFVMDIMLKAQKKSQSIFEVFARGVSMFYSEFFKHQYNWLPSAIQGNQQGIQVCQYGFRYLLFLMKIDRDQVFKIIIEFFYSHIKQYIENKNQLAQFNNSYFNKNQQFTIDIIYPDIFQEVMKVVVLKMVKPEEVLIVIDQLGVPVKQDLQNTQNSALYQVMKQLAVYLVQYNWDNMKKFILSEIQKQYKEQFFSFDTLNSLSWVVGSLYGSILDKEEKAFFINSLRTLLQLCENKKGKNNKAVIASCIMYVVGQYPAFLKNNWSFLKTVVRKLFEFMKEEFPGIMEMACNTFLKIAKNTCEQFVMLQTNEQEPYIREIIRKIPDQTKKLNNDVLLMTFFQSIGYLISAEPNAQLQLELMKETLGVHFFEFQQIISMAQDNDNVLREEQVQRKLIYFLKMNEVLAQGVGQKYVLLLELISQTLNKLYLFYSGEVEKMVRQNGKNILNYMTVKMIRGIKKGVLRIYIKLIDKCTQLDNQRGYYILNTFVFPLGPMLEDFQVCQPETKEQEFVALFTAILEKLWFVLDALFLSKLLEMIFASSLPLINMDFNSFPQIRANFFSFLKALIKHNFSLLFSLQVTQFETILNCVIWSLRHQLNNFCDLGLELLQEMLNHVNQSSQVIDPFYSRYHIKILTNILEVTTDGYHKSGLGPQSKLLYVLIKIITQNMVPSPISSDQGGKSNAEYLYNFLVERLYANYSNISKNQTMEKVANWFKINDQKMFRDEVADYLVLINRYSPQEAEQSTALSAPDAH